MLVGDLLESILIASFASLPDLCHVRVVVHLFEQLMCDIGGGAVVVEDGSRDIVGGLIAASFDVFDDDVERA